MILKVLPSRFQSLDAKNKLPNFTYILLNLPRVKILYQLTLRLTNMPNLSFLALFKVESMSQNKASHTVYSL